MKFSVRQILASAAGAVLAALIASAFGVKGTIVGVAIGSVAATTGSALIAQSIERGHAAVKQVVVRAPETNALLRRFGGTGTSGASAGSVEPSSAPTETHPTTSTGSDENETVEMRSPPAPTEGTQRLETSAAAGLSQAGRSRAVTTPSPFVRSTTVAPRRFTWKAIAGTAAIVFVLGLLFITAIELIAGKPLSSIFGNSATGTTVKNIFAPSPAPPPVSTTTSTTGTTTSTSTTSSTTTSTTSATSGSTTTTTTAPGATTTTTTGSVGATTTTTTSPVSVTVP